MKKQIGIIGLGKLCSTPIALEPQHIFPNPLKGELDA